MSQLIDNLIAFRVLRMLVTPFKDTQAYKLGIIDENGEVLKKTKDFTTSAEKNAYTMLHRMVFRLKKLLAKVPGGSTRLASFTAAYFLIKEYTTSGKSVAHLESDFHRLCEQIEKNEIVLIEEIIEIEQFLSEMKEEVPANATGVAVSTDAPVYRKGMKRRYQSFDVSPEVFRRFAKGKKKFRKWSDYLNIQDETERGIYAYARKNPKGILILKNSETGEMKGVRFNRMGGGSWSKLQRKRVGESE